MIREKSSLIIEGLYDNKGDSKGAKVVKWVRGLSEKEKQDIISNVKGHQANPNIIDLTDDLFTGMLVDIEKMSKFDEYYTVSIKLNKNKPWNSKWTTELKKLNPSKYNNGYLLTGYPTRKEAENAYKEKLKSNEDSDKKDIETIKKFIGKKEYFWDYEYDDDFLVVSFSNGKFAIKYRDGKSKEVDVDYLTTNTDLAEEV